MIVIIILVVLAAIGAAIAVAVSKSKSRDIDATSASASLPAPAPSTSATDVPPVKAAAPEEDSAPSGPLPDAGPKKIVTRIQQDTPAPEPQPDAPPAAPAEAPVATPAGPRAADAPADISAADAAAGDDDEPDLSRFSTGAAAKRSTESTTGAKPAVAFRYPMESSPTDVPSAAPTAEAPVEAAPVPTPDEKPEPVSAAADAVADVPSAPLAAKDPEAEPAFDLERVTVAPLVASDAEGEAAEEDATAEDATAEDATAEDATAEDEPTGSGATVTRLEPRSEPELSDVPLASVVADLIDAEDPEIAEVMARLIDASDPELVAQLVDSDGLEVGEVVAKLMDAADPSVKALVNELAEAPDRRQVAEVLRLVDGSYTGDDAGLPADITDKLEELDIEADLELTSRPAEMAQFARLDNKDQLRVIIRVLCGLVAREDLPRSPRMPAQPASSAENRRWPLSRARWPVPPPTGEDIVKRAPLPGRRTSSVAS